MPVHTRTIWAFAAAIAIVSGCQVSPSFPARPVPAGGTVLGFEASGGQEANASEGIRFLTSSPDGLAFSISLSPSTMYVSLNVTSIVLAGNVTYVDAEALRSDQGADPPSSAVVRVRIKDPVPVGPMTLDVYIALTHFSASQAKVAQYDAKQMTAQTIVS